MLYIIKDCDCQVFLHGLVYDHVKKYTNIRISPLTILCKQKWWWVFGINPTIFLYQDIHVNVCSHDMVLKVGFFSFTVEGSQFFLHFSSTWLLVNVQGLISCHMYLRSPINHQVDLTKWIIIIKYIPGSGNSLLATSNC